MGKRDDLIKALQPLRNDRKKLEAFIVTNSNLPGPRANLELAFACADVCTDIATLQEWLAIPEEQAGVVDPRSFLPFCAAVCLGKQYTLQKNRKIITLLQKAAEDGRWRIREAVAFGFQIIGGHDFGELEKIFSAWMKKSGNLQKRAMLVALAHPPSLSRDTAGFCFEMTEYVLTHMDRETDFEVLKKGLCFTVSVFVAADPEAGFRFMRKWIGKDRVIDRIMKENLKKNRLVKKYPLEVEALLGGIG